MKEIQFSQLTLDLKKQFIYFLAKNDIDFHRLKDSRFMRTKIRITNSKSNKSPARIVLRPEDIDHLCRKRGKPSKFHIHCTEEAWAHDRRHRTPKICKYRKSKSKGRLNKPSSSPATPHSGKKIDQSGDKKTPSRKKKKPGDKGYMNMRSNLRAEPNRKVSLKKHGSFVKNRNNLYPNKEFNPKTEDIHYPDDYQDKDHFYLNLRKRLDYNRSHKLDDKRGFKEYDNEHPEEIILDFKKSRKISRFLDELSGREPINDNYKLDLADEKIEKLKLKDYFKDLDAYERGRKNKMSNRGISNLTPGRRPKSVLGARKASNKSIHSKKSRKRLQSRHSNLKELRKDTNKASKSPMRKKSSIKMPKSSQRSFKFPTELKNSPNKSGNQSKSKLDRMKKYDAGRRSSRQLSAAQKSSRTSKRNSSRRGSLTRLYKNNFEDEQFRQKMSQPVKPLNLNNKSSSRQMVLRLSKASESDQLNVSFDQILPPDFTQPQGAKPIRKKSSKTLKRKESKHSLKSSKSTAGKGSRKRSAFNSSMDPLGNIFQDEIDEGAKDKDLQRKRRNFKKAMGGHSGLTSGKLDSDELRFIIDDLNEGPKGIQRGEAKNIKQSRKPALCKYARGKIDKNGNPISTDRNLLEKKLKSGKNIEDEIARMYVKSTKKKNTRFNDIPDEKQGTDRTQPEDLYDFHTEIDKLKQRALEEGEGRKFGYYADYDNGKGARTNFRNISGAPSSRRLSSDRRTRQKEKRLLRQKQHYHIPSHMDERIRKRKEEKERVMHTPTRMRKSKSMLRYSQGLRSPEFKNDFKSGVKLKVGLDMLHTDELMGYYKEVISKGKRDLITHQRQQNIIKKLERV